MYAGKQGFLSVALVAFFVACAAQDPRRVVATRELPEGSGVPRIESIADLGGQEIPSDGILPGVDSDGVVVVGETLWIRGAGFGRQPTVRVGERPAQILARTADGGILVRVPAGTPAGRHTLEISQRSGTAAIEVTVRRYALLLPAQLDRVAWLEIDGEGARLAGTTPWAGLFHLAMSGDGRAAYATGAAGGTLDVIDLAAGPRRPAPVYRMELEPGPIHAVVAAARAPILVLIRPGTIALFDTSVALRPARRTPQPLPAALDRAPIVAAAISPDGAWLALARGDENQIVLLDLERLRRGQPPRMTAIDLDTDAHVPVLVDLTFTPGGETLWVLSGERASARAAGPRPTHAHALRFVPASGAEAATLKLVRTVVIPEAMLPCRIATSRKLALASGAAVRLPPELVTVFLTAEVRGEHRHAVYAVGAGAMASEVATVPGKLDAITIEPEGTWLLAAFLDEEGGLRVLQARVDGRAGEPRALPIPPGAPGLLHEPGVAPPLFGAMAAHAVSTQP